MKDKKTQAKEAALVRLVRKSVKAHIFACRKCFDKSSVGWKSYIKKRNKNSKDEWVVSIKKLAIAIEKDKTREVLEYIDSQFTECFESDADEYFRGGRKEVPIKSLRFALRAISPNYNRKNFKLCLQAEAVYTDHCALADTIRLETKVEISKQETESSLVSACCVM